MIIVGAGMAGLLAAHMLRRYGVTVWEAQPQLPDNHGALLRFRTNAVAEATGIPFRKVRVAKAVKWRTGGGAWAFYQDTCPLAAQNSYAAKVVGRATVRSVMDLRPADRYIAPSTFLADLAQGITVLYNKAIDSIDDLEDLSSNPWISTIPMPFAAKLADRDDTPAFPHRPVWSLRMDLGPNVDLYQTIYYPNPSVSFYRASLTGRMLTMEYLEQPRDGDFDIANVLADFGLFGGLLDEVGSVTDVKRQEYGKLLPIEEQWRRAFIVYLTTRYNMYSVGRFATWRQILLDDVVHDVRQVAAMIEDRTPYLRMLRTENGRY